jgi:hypothetical protein
MREAVAGGASFAQVNDSFIWVNESFRPNAYRFFRSSSSSRGSGGGSLPRGLTAVRAGGGGSGGGRLGSSGLGTGGMSQSLWTGMVWSRLEAGGAGGFAGDRGGAGACGACGRAADGGDAAGGRGAFAFPGGFSSSGSESSHDGSTSMVLCPLRGLGGAPGLEIFFAATPRV